jgi:hypothetical protein
MSAPTTGLVARWTARRQPDLGTRCDECGAVLAGTCCDGCGQLAGGLVAMLATVIDTPAGARLVIAEHGPEGWTPLRTVAATRANVAALGRPGATGPAVAVGKTTGGLW